MGFLDSLFNMADKKELKNFAKMAEKINTLEPKFESMRDKELKNMTSEFKERLANGETLDDILPEAFAVVREASKRVLGLRQYDVQFIGGMVLHQGRIAEMKTGEGKTLVAAAPVYLNALEGKGVHVVTVNDYLAKRDKEEMGKVYEFLGLTVGVIVHGQTPEVRRAQYNCDITYGTNNEYGFDYLKDNMVIHKEQKVQRELNYAIVDEVDSILIDEARTPLIISGPGDKSTHLYTDANTFVLTLKAPSKTEQEKTKEEKEAHFSDGDYDIDEKQKSASLTESGIKKAEVYFNVDNITDIEHTELYHHINQALKAHAIMKKDVDYVVKDGEIIIVDEFTGRLMFGRRYSEGLHQAIEAKEGLHVQRESKTLATITFQNYFRMYKKLSGMTGTAKTEEEEFKSIYKMDVVVVPTNKPVQREDLPDVVYKNENGKFNAVAEDILERHKKQQPVLVGTVSIDKSEKLSQILKRKGIKHEVLNAKNHEKEAEIVAQAGRLGAVTIATNMAGRGTDIMLGGNPLFLTKKELKRQGFTESAIKRVDTHIEEIELEQDEELAKAKHTFDNLYEKYKEEAKKEQEAVRAAGGLAIIGTERHESRRIDNQLRGRSGRQGDPGSSRFYIGLDDELMRLFGSERIQGVVEKIGLEEDMPVEHRMLTKSIENAQKKVEGQNFDTRKNLLDYDDVLRQQREIMYKQRDTILFSDSIFDSIQKYFERAAEGLVSESIVEIDQEKVVDETKLIKLVEPKYLAPGTINPTDFHQIPADEATDFLATIMYKIYLKKRKGWSDDVANYVEKTVTLQQVDKNWTKHIDTMSKLRESIYLRSYANSNPLQAYTNEGYDLFNKMALTISDEVVNNLLHVQVRVTPQPQQPAPEAQPATDAEEVKEVRETPTEEPKQEEVKEENKEQN